MSRKLASIREIKALLPIKKADRIELAQVDGWWCIVKKGEFKVGDLGVYFEIDSLLPNEEIYNFLGRAGQRNGVYAHRIKTMKMRGVISQGLLLPISHFGDKLTNKKLGDDVTDILKVTKFEVDNFNRPPNSKIQAHSRFPSFLPKTEQTRIQNIPQFFSQYKEMEFEETLKLDGSSYTAFRIKKPLAIWQRLLNTLANKVLDVDIFDTKDFGVCSRNLRLEDESLKGSSDMSNFWKVTVKYNIDVMLPLNYAIQGELVAPNIQRNHEKVSEPELYIFDVFDIENQKYLLPHERRKFMKKYFNMSLHVPVINSNVKIFTECDTVEELLSRVEGQSMNEGTESEGRVYKSCIEPSIHFKAISNKYLLKEK
jgi:RNA ligase (TIGR02306 family)